MQKGTHCTSPASTCQEQFHKNIPKWKQHQRNTLESKPSSDLVENRRVQYYNNNIKTSSIWQKKQVWLILSHGSKSRAFKLTTQKSSLAILICTLRKWLCIDKGLIGCKGNARKTLILICKMSYTWVMYLVFLCLLCSPTPAPPHRHHQNARARLTLRGPSFGRSFSETFVPKKAAVSGL